MQHLFRRLLALAVLCVTAVAHATPHEELTRLAEEMTYTSARLFPLRATALGIAGYDSELDDPSEEVRGRWLQQVLRWRERLHALTAALPRGASLPDRHDAQWLGSQLARELNLLQRYQSDRKDYAAGATSVIGALFTQLQFLPIAGQDGATAAEVEKAWTDITSRLGKVPAYLRAAQRLATRPGRLQGKVGSQTLAGAPELFNGALTAAAASHYGQDHGGYDRFVRARDAALEAIAETKSYIDAHVEGWPENFAIGRQNYERLLREEQLLPFGTRDIERVAEAELAHGWAEEAWLQSVSKYEQLPCGAQSGGGLAPGGEALIDYYRERIADLRNYVTRHDIVTVPDWLGAISVQQTPAFMQPVSPGASMIPPRAFSPASDGYYFITPPVSLLEAAARLDMNQDFDRDRILSTGAHEAMPGHFLQTSVARRHPNFIRKTYGTLVFEEGWAYYGEEMLVRLGLYGSNLDARLYTARWERVRGARAIVDIRLATGEWSHREAADFYARETGFTQDAADAAVAGYAVSPGIAICYTTGRLQLRQLLADYQRLMGSRGSLHDFHDRLLSYGAIPFALLGPELMADLGKPASAVRAAANY